MPHERDADVIDVDQEEDASEGLMDVSTQPLVKLEHDVPVMQEFPPHRQPYPPQLLVQPIVILDGDEIESESARREQRMGFSVAVLLRGVLCSSHFHHGAKHCQVESPQ
ncbi:hypothetical protein M427DRAFT_421451 [Gonapodya prolifera JEL478]|uniref:Uncharacterized protein n=1 Tax=Gonapodya prolifera (strain JEL478) TaxID=1344416 RepID=A0A139A5I1_GONPJ|nr:hypothetical protein M427DRAFT_421451 [Gonapodya prolifera JEL478]|eukprot:KXS11725.1 hypothetical protein M427DRAFT_421451 [Gonapodya prolifera JEL478]